MIAQIDKEYLYNHKKRLAVRFASYALFEGRPLTTKGRWINPLIFFLFMLLKRFANFKKVDSPIYIIGAGRSGTTVLGVVLSTHRHVGFLNEPKAMWHSFFPNEDVVGNYSRGDAFYRLDADQVDDKVRQYAHRLYGAYAFCVARKRVVDKYPEVVFRVPFVRGIFPDARFVFLTRNGWDACSSITSWSKRNGQNCSGEVHDWWGVDQRKWNLMKTQLIRTDPELVPIYDLVDALEDHRLMAAVEWVVTMREGMRVAQLHQDAVMTLRYEDLVDSPRLCLKKLFEFCRLDDDEDCLRYADRVLQPVKPYPVFDMPNELRVLFDDTMRQLGYC